MTTSQQPDDQTVRLGSAPLPPEDTTIRLDPKAPVADTTVRLDPKAPVADTTVRLGAKEPVADTTVRLGAKDADATVLLPGAAAQAKALDDSATVRDPEVWPTVAPVAPAAAAAPAGDGLQRFGPGVPPLAAATWHGTAAPVAPAPPRRRRRGWLVLPLVLLLAVLGYLTWPWFGNQVAVSGATVRTDPAGPSCDGTAVVTGTLETNGGAGTVTYHWIRSDGTDSGTLSQQVSAGERSTDVVLRWTFQGHGTMEATATLQVLTPDQHSASVSFPYNCP
jgi:cytochrome c5